MASRLSNAIITPNQGLATFASSPLLDLTNGGMHGVAPDLSEWVSNQAYVSRNVIPILLEAPKFFQLMPNPSGMVQILKSLIELHSRTVEGLNMGLEVEVEEHPVGGAGEMQAEPTKVTRARSTPSITYIEKYGTPIAIFHDIWIRYGIMDPDTLFPLSSTLAGQKPEDQLADWYSATVIFIQPDPTGQFCHRAWLVTNMFPKSNGEIVGKKDKTVAGELTTITIEYPGITQSGLGVNILGQNILNAINLSGANPAMRPAFLQSVAADVQNATKGWASSVSDLATNAVVRP